MDLEKSYGAGPQSYGIHTSPLGRQQAYSDETMWKWEITKPKKRTREEARPLRKEARGPNGMSLIVLEDTDSSLSVISENSLACDEGTTSIIPQLPSDT